MVQFRTQVLLSLCIFLSSLANATTPIIADAEIPNMAPMKGTPPCKWRVIWSGDASTEATKQEGSKHRMLYGTDPSKLDQLLECQANKQYRYGSEPKKVRNAYYRLTGLKPDTNCHFVMESDGELSKML